MASPWPSCWHSAPADAQHKKMYGTCT